MRPVELAVSEYGGNAGGRGKGGEAMTARKTKRSEGLHSGGKAGERSGKRHVSSLSPRPSGRTRTESPRKFAPRKRVLEWAAWAHGLDAPTVESRLSPAGGLTPSAMVSRIARISSGYVVTATFYGPDYVRHEVEASAPTFAGVLAELASAVAGALGAAQ
jgi:hypothetical protein